MSPPSQEVKAIELLSPRKFHRIFTAPATDHHGPLKVTYAIAGVDVDEAEDIPTILFCGGMFGTRWQAPWLDFISKKEGVRMIFIDRPGFGGSTPVAINKRIPTFLEVVPLLLAHLKIKHIALACQSAGTTYALNMLVHHPELLSPTCPTVTFFSPWVHQSITSVSFLTLASMLPNKILNRWNKVMKFVVNTAQPSFAVSGGAFTFATSAFKDKVKSAKEKEEEARKCLDGYGIPLELKDKMDKTVFKFAFAENSVGANDEARLCLKSIDGTTWDACDNYEECVKTLAQAWDNRIEEGGKPLRVCIFLPETDMMVGEKGMKYFQKCWQQENCGIGMKVECMTLKGTDHETTANPSEGGIGRMFSVVKDLQTMDETVE